MRARAEQPQHPMEGHKGLAFLGLGLGLGLGPGLGLGSGSGSGLGSGLEGYKGLAGARRCHQVGVLVISARLEG